MVSDDAEGHPYVAPTQPSRKRHRYRSFKEQVHEITIDTYKSLIPRQAAPGGGASSFFQEKLATWRELNASHDWLLFYKEVQPLCTTLPQLVYHQGAILDALLSRLDMRYALSLEPLLDLLVHLSRDLASDFVLHFPRAVEAIERVVLGCGERRGAGGVGSKGFMSEGGGMHGGEGAGDDLAAGDGANGVSEISPEAQARKSPRQGHASKPSNYDVSTQALHAANLKAAFGALSGICKNLASYLVLDLRPVLKVTGGLRAHRSADVRRLAGEALGYLLRRASDDVAREGVRYLIEEVRDAWLDSIAQQGTGTDSTMHHERLGACGQRALDLCEGNGAVLASAIKGVKGGLHSRCGRVLGMVFSVVEEVHRMYGDDGSDDGDNGDDVYGMDLEVNLTGQEDDGDAAVYVTMHAFFASCFEYVREADVLDPLWEAVIGHCQRGVARSSGLSLVGVARMSQLMASLVGHRGGSRAVAHVDAVFDLLENLFAYVARTLSEPHQHGERVVVEGREGCGVAQSGREEAGALAMGFSNGFRPRRTQQGLESARMYVQRYLDPHLVTSVLALAEQFLRVLCKRRIYSKELFGSRLTSWNDALVALDTQTYVNFVLALIDQQGPAKPLGHSMQVELHPHSTVESHRHHRQKDQEGWDALWDATIPLAFEKLANELSEDAERIFAWEGALAMSSHAARASQTSRRGISGAVTRALGSSSLDVVWAAIEVGADVCDSQREADAFYAKALKRASIVDSANACVSERGTAPPSKSTSSPRVAVEAHAHSFRVDAICRLAALGIPIKDRDIGRLTSSLETLIDAHPTDRHVLRAAAKLVSAFPTPFDASTSDRLLERVSIGLSSSSSSVRVDCLTLCISLISGGAQCSGDVAEVPGSSNAASALSHLLDLETHPLGADSGRHAAVTLSRIQNLIEYKRIPVCVVIPCVRGLLGLLYFKLSSYWGPASKALAAAVDAFPDKAWPVLVEALADVEAEVKIDPADGSTMSEMVEDDEDDECPGDGDEEGCADNRRDSGKDGADDDNDDGADEIVRRLTRGRKRSRSMIDDEKLEEGGRVIQDARSHPSSYLAAMRGGEMPHSDAAARMSHHLKTLALTSVGLLTNRSKDWVPIFLRCVTEEVGYCLPLSMRRSILREWLKVLQSLKKNVKRIHKSDEVLRAVCSRIMDIDPLVQSTVLESLRPFDLKWLNPYLDSLLRLANNKTLRSELTAFQLDPSSDFIQSDHRSDIVPFLIAALFPRMRKRNGRLGGKGAPGSARAAILNFLSAAHPAELRALLELFLLPMADCFIHRGDKVGSCGERIYLSSTTRAPPRLDEPGCDWLKRIDVRSLAAQPANRHIGYLNAIDDLAKHLGFKLAVFLPMISALIAKMLSLAVENEEKEVRIKCIRLFSSIVGSYGAHVPAPVYCMVFQSVERFVPLIAVECNAERPPALVELCGSVLSLKKDERVIGIPTRLLGGSLDALSAPHCSPGCASAVLDIVETVIDDSLDGGELANDEIRGMKDGKLLQGEGRGDMSALLPHADALLAGLDCILTDFRKQRALAVRSLNILEILASSSFFGNNERISDALLSMLSIPRRKWQSDDRRRLSPGNEALIARACACLSAMLGERAGGGVGHGEWDPQHSESKKIESLAPLILVLTTQDARESLCAALSSYHDCRETKLLKDLNAFSLTEPDYDRRLDAYGKLAHDFLGSNGGNKGAFDRFLVYQCCVDLASPNDLSLRHSAARALGRLLEEAAGKASTESATEFDNSLFLVKNVLMPEIRVRIAASTSQTVRQEHVEMVRLVARRLPGAFPELQAITNEEDDLDFWSNVCHVQLHRRARAFERVKRTCEATGLDQKLVENYLLVLIEKAVQDDDGKGGVSASVTDAAVGCLSSLDLEERAFLRVLERFLGLCTNGSGSGSGSAGKGYLRAVSILLETNDAGASPDARGQGIAGDAQGDASVDAAVAPSVLQNPASSTFVEFASTKLIPFLHANLEDRKKESVRAPVAASMVKLLKRLPEDMMRDELPKILQTVCNLLRVRLQRIRDDAREVLVSLSTELGDRYLMYVLHVLKSSLPMRGFTAHVLGYTTYFVLEGLDVAGSLRIADDSLVMVILSIVEGDLFGDVAEAKEVDAFASSYKESKRCKSYDIIRILGKCLEREEDLIRTLSWIAERSNHVDTPKARNKIASLLASLRKGLSLGTGAISVSNLVCGIAGFSGDDALRKDQLLEFALGVANDRLSGAGIDDVDDDIRTIRNDDTAAAMKAIQPIAVQAISTSKRSGCVVEALRILKACRMHGEKCANIGADRDIEINSTSISTASATIPYGPVVRAALKSAADSPVGRETLSLLTHAIQSKKRVLDDRTMGKVIKWAGVSSTDSYRLHKALIKARHVIPEVYDSMNAIAAVMVKSTDKTIRQLASSTMLAFLLDYPLGKKRLDHHVQFLLSNMSYEHSEGGRGAVCELLCHLARKFPSGVKKRFYDKFVFFAFARAANEESREVRRRVVDDLLVCGLASPELYGKYLGGFLDISAASVFLVVERSEAWGFDLFWKDQAERVMSLLVAGAKADHPTDHLTIHKGLAMLEKHADRIPDASVSPIFQVGKSLLEHPHEWVRTAASRLVGRLIGGDIVDGRRLIDEDESYRAFLRVLDERDISDELAKATLRNLFFVLCAGDDDASARVFDGITRNARRNLEHRLKFVGMACSCGKESVVGRIPADVVCRLLVPVLEDEAHPTADESVRRQRGRGKDHDREEDHGRDLGRKALAREVFNSIVGAVGHDRALRGYNAAKERRAERQRDRRARRAGQRLDVN